MPVFRKVLPMMEFTQKNKTKQKYKQKKKSDNKKKENKKQSKTNRFLSFCQRKTKRHFKIKARLVVKVMMS